MYKFTLFVCFIFCINLQAQQWTEAASLPSSMSRHHPVTFAINGYGYTLTGTNTSFIPTDDSYRYDPSDDSWTQIADFPGPDRSFSYGVVSDDYAYLGFGSNGLTNALFNDLWRFDPSTETWEQMSNCPCQGRTHPALILVNDKIFVGLGGGGGDKDDWWEYDIPTDTWSEKPDFPGLPRHHPFYFEIGDLAYVGFGHGGPNIFRDFYSYNPDTDVWTQLADFPGEGRVAGTQFSHDGYGYVLSGDGDDHDYMLDGEFWQYDPTDDSWTQLDSHPGLSRWAPGSFVLNGEAYFLQGEERFLDQFPNAALANDMWKFDLDLLNNPTGFSDLSDNGISLFPNPSNGWIRINDSDQLIEDQAQVRVFNLLGNKVMDFQLQEQLIDLSALEAGSYLLQINSEGNVFTEQMILQ